MPIDPALARHLRELEERLLRPDVRASSGELSALLHPDFAEIGSSGRRYSKAEVIATLGVETPGDYEIADFSAQLVSPEVALVTYTVTLTARGEGKPRKSLRSSVWRRGPESWQLLHHQGTPRPER